MAGPKGLGHVKSFAHSQNPYIHGQKILPQPRNHTLETSINSSQFPGYSVKLRCPCICRLPARNGNQTFLPVRFSAVVSKMPTEEFGDGSHSKVFTACNSKVCFRERSISPQQLLYVAIF